jgi:hypothetical protein
MCSADILAVSSLIHPIVTSSREFSRGVPESICESGHTESRETANAHIPTLGIPLLADGKNVN